MIFDLGTRVSSAGTAAAAPAGRPRASRAGVRRRIPVRGCPRLTAQGPGGALRVPPAPHPGVTCGTAAVAARWPAGSAVVRARGVSRSACPRLGPAPGDSVDRAVGRSRSRGMSAGRHPRSSPPGLHLASG